jgi:hypothetical protein
MSADKILLSTQTELREYASQVPFANISTLHKSKEIELEAQQVLHSLSELKKRQDLSGAELIEREEVLYKRLHELTNDVVDFSQRKEKYTDKHQSLDGKVELLETVARGHKQTTVEKLPVYTDEWNMFTRFPIDESLQEYILQMMSSMKTVPSETAVRVVQDARRDGNKDLLQTMLHSNKREEWFDQSSKKLCTGCWSHVLPQLFQMVSELMVVEFRKRLRQIVTMVNKRDLTSTDGYKLAKEFSNALKVMNKLVDQSQDQKKIKRKKDWTEMIRKLFTIIVEFVNELMMRYVLLAKMKVKMNKSA